jgi:hypothetical protein
VKPTTVGAVKVGAARKTRRRSRGGPATDGCEQGSGRGQGSLAAAARKGGPWLRAEQGRAATRAGESDGGQSRESSGGQGRSAAGAGEGDGRKAARARKSGGE